ncbi:alpha/beta hydrolase [Amycolatopsis sp. FDAARGOS 1241]|uniref:alpha/beta hydrolase n=1 Tax=Amycolatopsis sp. FDAARGOS 1241 TaxID=2778070 RepID=UPI001950246D|nr:alpha/beta hydrolase [Amycolatopsis sp. FDAARGOS 1241]QRP47962.1 alpha/beta hydrolase [Amycolatopsis sp. FDAARGOS 1241]
MSSLVYGGYHQADLDRQYSPSSCVADISTFLTAYAVQSAQTRTEVPVRTDILYGSLPCETVDFFSAPGPDAPLLVFVHGGYWRELSKSDSSFPARGLVPAGAAFAAIDYGLAPEYRLDEIVGQVRRGIWWLVENARDLGVDSRRITLAGSSAGAHLVLMALLDGWMPAGTHPTDVFAGAILLSGVYDLEPVRHTYVNEPLGLDADAAARLSPIRHLPDRLPPLVIARGGAETAEFARQHSDLVKAATSRSAAVSDLVITHRNHFDITFDLDDPDSELGAAVLRQLGLSGRTSTKTAGNSVRFDWDIGGS